MSPKDPTLAARLDAFINFKVKHPRLEGMDQDLMRRISGYGRYTILAVFGSAGVRKSAVMQRVAEKLRAEELDPLVVPVVVIRANQEDVGASARLVTFARCSNSSKCMWRSETG